MDDLQQRVEEAKRSALRAIDTRFRPERAVDLIHELISAVEAREQAKACADVCFYCSEGIEVVNQGECVVHYVHEHAGAEDSMPVSCWAEDIHLRAAREGVGR